MKKFEILRYIKKFSALILIFALAGAYMIYRYGKNNQSYTATAVIQYTNSEASSGLTPNGQDINVEEIFSSTVITEAMEDLHLSGTVDYIRSRFNVQEIVPDEQQRINDALIEKGETPDYHATEYKVTFVADGTKSEDYARDVVDTVLQNYMAFYSEKYIEESVMPNAMLEIEGKDYDSLETVEILEAATTRMIGYLSEKAESYSDIKSSRTGYTFEDFFNIYQHMYDYEIPRIYARILTFSETKDKKVLVDRLNNDIETADVKLGNLNEQLDKLKSLIDNYSERNKAVIDYHYMRDNDENGTDYIIKNVEDNRAGGDVETTYDSLLKEYTDIRLQVELLKIEQNHDRYLLQTFSAYDGVQGDFEATDTLVTEYVEAMKKYNTLVQATAEELNEVLSAKYLKTVSTINVSSSINIKLYVALALVFFLIVGVFGSIVLGRLIDFIDYLLYIDKQVNLPNKASCDRQIADLAEALLPEDYTFLTVSFTALRKLTEKYGRAAGDRVLLDFSKILKEFGTNYGFVGYNGGGQFFGFFEDCNVTKLGYILKALEKNVAEYNAAEPGYEIEYTCNYANSTADGVYEIRELMRLAFSKKDRLITFPDPEKVNESEKAEEKAEAGKEDAEHEKPEIEYNRSRL